MQVTDEMVRVAHAEYHKVLGDKNRSDPMRQALTAALAAMWQPIDGEARRAGRILATGGGLGSNVEVVSYNEKIGCWDAETCTLDDRDNEADGYNRPTNYMPLPAPSQLSKRGDAERDSIQEA